MSTIKNVNRLLLSEVLQAINDDITLLNPGQPFEFHRNSALHKVFYYGFVKDSRFKLPEGDPPYTPSDQKPGMNAVDLLIAIRRGRFAHFVDPNINPIRREQLFISLLETVYQEEAKILLAIKDQRLTELYPNITYKVLYEAHYLPYNELLCTDKSPKSEQPTDKTEKPASTSRAKRGRPRNTTTKKTK